MFSINFHSNFMKYNKSLQKNNLKESSPSQQHTKNDNSLH